jgi:hypothetical protein
MATSQIKISDRQDDAGYVYHEHCDLAHIGRRQSEPGQHEGAQATKQQ